MTVLRSADDDIKELQICLATCLERDIVNGDFKDGDPRGFSAGHSIEKITQYEDARVELMSVMLSLAGISLVRRLY